MKKQNHKQKRPHVNATVSRLLFSAAMAAYIFGVWSIYQRGWELGVIYILLGTVFTLTTVCYDVIINEW